MAKEVIEQQFRWAIQALAQPPEVQPKLFPPRAAVPDELALDFDNHWIAFEAHFGNSLSEAQCEAVHALDNLLTEMSGLKPEIWLDGDCLRHPRWHEVRRLAGAVLAAFGWQPNIPPSERAAYVFP